MTHANGTPAEAKGIKSRPVIQIAVAVRIGTRKLIFSFNKPDIIEDGMLPTGYINAYSAAVLSEKPLADTN